MIFFTLYKHKKKPRFSNFRLFDKTVELQIPKPWQFYIYYYVQLESNLKYMKTNLIQYFKFKYASFITNKTFRTYATTVFPVINF